MIESTGLPGLGGGTGSNQKRKRRETAFFYGVQKMGMVEKQDLFASMAAQLIAKAQSMGYQVTLGEAYRSKEEAARLAATGAGVRRSLHCERMAIDLNLFLGGRWLDKTLDHLPLGEWWESIGGAWGGRWGDGNHYSLAYEGRK